MPTERKKGCCGCCDDVLDDAALVDVDVRGARTRLWLRLACTDIGRGLWHASANVRLLFYVWQLLAARHFVLPLEAPLAHAAIADVVSTSCIHARAILHLAFDTALFCIVHDRL